MLVAPKRRAGAYLLVPANVLHIRTGPVFRSRIPQLVPPGEVEKSGRQVV